MTDRSLPRAFHPKARSHCPVALLGEGLRDGMSEYGEINCAVGVDLDQATKPQRTERCLLIETVDEFRLGPATVEMPGMALSGNEAFGSDDRAAIAMNFYVRAR